MQVRGWGSVVPARLERFLRGDTRLKSWAILMPSLPGLRIGSHPFIEIMQVDETNGVGVREVGTTNTVMRMKSCLTIQTEQTGAGARKPDVVLVGVVIRAPVVYRESYASRHVIHMLHHLCIPVAHLVPVAG